MKLLIVSGLSGSGKSVALHALEDLGFYCIDNLPLALLPAFAGQLQQARRGSYEHAAVGVDARNLAEDFEQVPTIVEEVAGHGLDCEILFLEADDSTLLKRFSETRRRHPLSSTDTPLAEAIAAERALLAPVSEHADWHIDTSHTNIYQLRDLIREQASGCDLGVLSLLFLSFGYKHGVPADADFVFDVRCLPNPYWETELRPHTGLDDEVTTFLERQPLVREMLHGLQAFLTQWVPHFEAGNRSYMTIAVGCTGGQHRSVYMVERLAASFRQQRENVSVRHRELA